jgi:peptidoglycan hydrolase-like protein with peptidoglycan-binding domain
MNRREPVFDDFERPRRPRRAPRARSTARTWLFTPLRIADSAAIAVAIAATIVVCLNALTLQGAHHPAPLFASRQVEHPQLPVIKRTVPAAQAPAVATPAAPATLVNIPVPQPRPENAPPRPRPDLVIEIQRELVRHGYYDGAVDGTLSPRTSQAIREFEQAQGLRATGEPSEALLGQIRRAKPKSEITGSIRPATVPVANRVIQVQRVLARYGYGPVRPSGTYDNETRAAIERFERDRNLSVTGEVSDRLIRELAAVTGSPLD